MNASKNDSNLNPQLVRRIKNMRPDRQLVLLKQLLKDDITGLLFQLIGELSEDQQSLLLKQLEESPDQPVSIDETEIAIRNHSRKSCIISVEYTVAKQKYQGLMLDISPAGAFIETKKNFSPGQEVRMTFSLPNQLNSISVTGEILWKGILGIGVKFKKIAPRYIDIIHAFVEGEDNI